MREIYVYHGHSIDLDLSDIAGDRMRWTYFIDGSYCIQGATESSSIEAVRVDALALAHRSIDILDLMHLGKVDVPASCAMAPGLVPAIMDQIPPRIAVKSRQGST